MLLTDSFLDYLLHERNYSKGTVEYYRADILELQRFGEEMLGDLTPLDVDAELVRESIEFLLPYLPPFYFRLGDEPDYTLF